MTDRDQPKRRAWAGPGRAALLALAVLLPTGAAPVFGQAYAPGWSKAPKDGGARRLEVLRADAILRAEATEAAPDIARVSRGDPLRNLGCDLVAAELWCEVRPLQGAQTGWIRGQDVGPAEGPDGRVAFGVDDSRKRARARKFDATTEIPCAQEQGETLGTCTAGIARSGGGDATIAVTFANGFTRQLYFEHGAFRKASATMSGVGTDSDWTLRDGVHRIRVDDQRFEVPQVFLLGQ